MTRQPLELTVVVNDERQAMLISLQAWPVPPPSSLQFKSTGHLIQVSDGDGRHLAVAQVSAARGLLMALEIFLGEVQGDRIATVGKVEHRWT